MVAFAIAAASCGVGSPLLQGPLLCALEQQPLRRVASRSRRRQRSTLPVASSMGSQAGTASPAKGTGEVAAGTPQRELLDIVCRSDGVNRRARVLELIRELEAIPNARPETALFAEFALAASGGRWEMNFSTSPVTLDELIRVRKLIQTIDAEEKTLTNSCFWTLVGDDGADIECVLDIRCKYSFSDDSPLIEVVVDSHQLQVLPQSDGKESPKLPSDLQSLIQRLQGSLPLEIWDPSGGQDPATFMDPDCRIACMLTEKLQGVRTVYKRIDE